MQRTPTWRRSKCVVGLLCGLLLMGCETPVNDVDLRRGGGTSAPTTSGVDEPPATSDVDETLDATSDTLADDVTAVEEVSDAGPDLGGDVSDAAGASPDAVAEPETVDDVVADAEPAEAPCDSEVLCLAYWQAYSDCHVAHFRAPEAAVDPSRYVDDCASLCALESRIDFETFYACLSTGVPDDCAAEEPHSPDCQT